MTEEYTDVLVVEDTEEHEDVETEESLEDTSLDEESSSEALSEDVKITQEILVTTTDPIKFATLLLEWGAKGAKLKEKSYVYLRRMPLQARLILETDSNGIAVTDANSKASPVYPYLTPEQFDELTWAEVVELGKKLGLKYGKRDEIKADYFAYVEREHNIVFKR